MSIAPGAPGATPTWCSSDKDFVTTALGASRLWATIGHGIINEVYWPATGTPQIRDFGFYLVGADRWIDLKRERRYRLSTPGPCLPALAVTHHGDDYELMLEILPDPSRDVLLVRYQVEGPYRLIVILAPHLQSTGSGNSAWIDDDAAFAQRGEVAICLTADEPMQHLSCGYVGVSDGWQDLAQHGRLTFDYSRVEAGTVAMSGQASNARGVLALAFATSARGARTLARSSLADSFDTLQAGFLAGWGAWAEGLRLPRLNAVLGDAGRVSATVLKIHEDRGYPGALVASLSVPWGNSTDTLGGYHLVWPRDATLTAFALLAANQVADVRRILGHLIATQMDEGRWPQNYFPTGEPFWTGIQLDEAAFPVLLAAKLHEMGQPDQGGTAKMVRAAVGFIVRAGPSSEQDRWEENPGVSPFTIAVAISALIAAAPWLEPAERAYAGAVADDWNERLEGWCYVEDTALARQHRVSGYYVRIARARDNQELAPRVQLSNRNGETIVASALVSMDFSYLVRLGLRDGRDPRIQNTIKVTDQVLRVETPSGALYHRYNEDGYGEHSDGSAFDGAGIGRGWPLLVGERGHLALQCGEDAVPYLQTMWNCASAGGLLPEQVWDTAPIPERGLVPGRPSGSAMPLLWSHAEFLKLLVAHQAGRPVELLQSVERRFLGRSSRSALAWHWRDEVPVTHLEDGRALTIEDRQPFLLHFGFDGWLQIEDREAIARPFGMWAVTLEASEFDDHRLLQFTRRYGLAWEGDDHQVLLAQSPIVHRMKYLSATH